MDGSAKLTRKRKSQAEKDAEKAAGEKAKQTAALLQAEGDLALLQFTKKENPYRHTVMKRKPSWMTIAAQMNVARGATDFDDRRCRERVAKLMEKYTVERSKYKTGDGTVEPTESEAILGFLVEEEEATASKVKVDKEKEEVNRVLTENIQLAALETMRDRITNMADNHAFLSGVAAEDDDDGTIPKKKKARVPYEKRNVGDSVNDYLSGKKDQLSKDAEVKLEMHRELMKDNESERALKREQMQIDRQRFLAEDAEKARRLQSEDEERARRHQKEREDAERMFSLLKDAVLAKKGGAEG